MIPNLLPSNLVPDPKKNVFGLNKLINFGGMEEIPNLPPPTQPNVTMDPTSTDKEILGMPSSRVPGEPTGNVDRSHLHQLEDQSDQLQAKPTLKQKLLGLATHAAPLALGGIFGGGYGLSGAAEGEVEEGRYENQQLKDKVAMLNKDQEDERTRLSRQQSEQAQIEANAPLKASEYDRNEAVAQHAGDWKRSMEPGTQVVLGPDGTPHVMMYDPASGGFNADQGRAAAHIPQDDQITRLFQSEYHRLPTAEEYAKFKTQIHPNPQPTFSPLTDPAGNITGRWNNRAGNASPLPALPGVGGAGQTSGTQPQSFRKSGLPSAILSNQVQGEGIKVGGQHLVDEVDNIAKFLGPGQGRVTNIEQMIGNPDPQVQQFLKHLQSWLALQPKFHGMRGTQVLAEFGKGMGANMTPQALKAGIQGTMETVGDMKQAQDTVMGGKGEEDVQEWIRDPKTNKLMPKLPGSK